LLAAWYYLCPMSVAVNSKSDSHGMRAKSLSQLRRTWILPDVWLKAKCTRSASEDRDSPAARRAAKHKTSVPLAVGKATLCALSAIFWHVGPRPRIRNANPQVSVFGARVTRLRVSVFSGATAPQGAQLVNLVVRWNRDTRQMPGSPRKASLGYSVSSK
jgi:hypothetical protein